MPGLSFAAIVQITSCCAGLLLPCVHRTERWSRGPQPEITGCPCDAGSACSSVRLSLTSCGRDMLLSGQQNIPSAAMQCSCLNSEAGGWLDCSTLSTCTHAVGQRQPSCCRMAPLSQQDMWQQAAGGSQSLDACFSHLLPVVCQPQVHRLSCTTLMTASGSSLVHLCSQ